MPVNCGPKGLPTDTNLLYHNRGDGTFADVSERIRHRGGDRALLDDRASRPTSTRTAGPTSTSRRDSTAAILYRNNRDGTFTDVAVESGAAYSENGNPQAGMGVAVGDYNGDGRLDLLKTHFADDIPSLYRNLGKGLFEDVATRGGTGGREPLRGMGRRAAGPRQRRPAGLVLRHRQRLPGDRSACCRSIRTGARGSCSGTRATARIRERHDARAATPRSPHSSRGAAFGDIDNDGDIDVLVMNMNEPPSLLRNDYSRRQRLDRARSSKGTRSNRSAIGATVVVSRRRARRRRGRCSASRATTRTTICGCISGWATAAGRPHRDALARGASQTLTNVQARRV